MEVSGPDITIRRSVEMEIADGAKVVVTLLNGSPGYFNIVAKSPYDASAEDTYSMPFGYVRDIQPLLADFLDTVDRVSAEIKEDVKTISSHSSK